MRSWKLEKLGAGEEAADLDGPASVEESPNAELETYGLVSPSGCGLAAAHVSRGISECGAGNA